MPLAAVIAFTTLLTACDEPAPSSPTGGGSSGQFIGSNAELFALVTSTDPFRSYVPFPGLATSSNGTLPASSAHTPNVRVSMNQTAFAALRDGSLPAGAEFPAGSILFKEVVEGDGTTSLYAIMFKERDNPLAGEGWLWAEIRPNGNADYPVTNRGAGCTPCHSLERGRQNDRVRIFERQR